MDTVECIGKDEVHGLFTENQLDTVECISKDEVHGLFTENQLDTVECIGKDEIHGLFTENQLDTVECTGKDDEGCDQTVFTINICYKDPFPTFYISGYWFYMIK